MSARGRPPVLRGLLVPLVPLMLWGCCSSQQTRLYHLAPQKPDGAVTVGERDLALAIGPVQIPRYLDRPQLVSRLSRNELRLSELDQWAEPLSRNLEAVLAENLLLNTGAREVNRSPRSGADSFDCRVDLRILRFEGGREGICHLTALWSLSGEALGAGHVRRRSVLEGPADGEGLAGVVGGLNGLLNRLSQEIAEEIVRRIPALQEGATQPGTARAGQNMKSFLRGPIVRPG